MTLNIYIYMRKRMISVGATQYNPDTILFIYHVVRLNDAMT